MSDIGIFYIRTEGIPGKGVSLFRVFNYSGAYLELPLQVSKTGLVPWKVVYPSPVAMRSTPKAPQSVNPEQNTEILQTMIPYTHE